MGEKQLVDRRIKLDHYIDDYIINYFNLGLLIILSLIEHNFKNEENIQYDEV
jgi:hypothetical protein